MRVRAAPYRAYERRAQVALRRVSAASAAGVHLIQIRERDLDAGALVRLVRQCLGAVDRRRTRVLVNDRLDVALAAGADGIHLRGDSMPAARARTLAPRGFLIGRSIRGEVEARDVCRDGGVDYLIFGTVFPSRSKPAGEASGSAALARVVRAASVPVLAIGGINAATIAGVADSGACGVAAIDLFFTAAETDMPSVISMVAEAFRGPRERVGRAPSLSPR